MKEEDDSEGGLNLTGAFDELSHIRLRQAWRGSGGKQQHFRHGFDDWISGVRDFEGLSARELRYIWDGSVFFSDGISYQRCLQDIERSIT